MKKKPTASKKSYKPTAKKQQNVQLSRVNVPRSECPICGSRNVHYNRERAELICRECGEIHAEVV